MIAIKLVDARRGLNIKCRELFKDEKIAEEIYRYLCDGIEECDDVEPERKHGKWEVVPDEVFADRYFCSVCRNEPIVDLYGEYCLSNYCPNCGAKMDGGKDDVVD